MATKARWEAQIWRATMGEGETITIGNRLQRLGVRLRDAEWRRYGYLLLAGKGLGLVVLFASMYLISGLIGHGVHAEDAAPPVLKGNDIVNPINTVWTLVAAFLVFGMQPGFTML